MPDADPAAGERVEARLSGAGLEAQLSGAGPEAAGPDPVLELLLDPGRLSELVGAPVRATRLRPKPGVSHTAALLDRGTGAPVGWLQALVGDVQVKADKALLKAGESGLAEQVRRLRVPRLDLTLVWGPLEVDPRLGRALAGIDLSSATVLRYNPLRRVVLKVGGYAVRITADRHRDRLTDLARRLIELGVPVQAPASSSEAGVPGGRRTSVWRWVEGHDLADAATPQQVAAAGELLATLHAVPPARLPSLSVRDWASQVTAARASVEQLTQVAPEAGAQARSALTRLSALPAPEVGQDVVLHGDFSLDQCFATAGAEGLVLGDLDRAALGPAEIDLAGALAVGLIDGADLEPLLDGYATASGRPRVAAADLAPWTAAALLARVTEPWRAQDPGWQDDVVRIARLAARLVPEVGPTAQPEAATSDRDDGWRVPATVTADGDRVEVRRAWPDKVVDGVARVSIEGPDGQGRLRAGTVDRAGRVRLHPPGQDRRLPALADVASQGRLVVHRSGRRAVVALPDRYVKVLRPGRAPAVAGSAESGRDLAAAAGLDAPAVLHTDQDRVDLAVVPGRNVHELSTDPAWGQVWDVWAQAWTRLQALPADALAPHLPGDEAQVLRTWAERAETAGVLHGTPWGERLDRTAHRLATSAAGPLVPTHRDLHDKQLLWHGDRLGILDFDTACRAEPQVDLANLAVHARLRRAQGLWSAEATQTVLHAVAQVAAAAGVDGDALGLAERATLARLAAVYAFRPPWRDLVLGWAEGEWAQASG